jgi:hypothetical protein
LRDHSTRQNLFDPLNGLPDPVFVLNQRKTDVPVSEFAETDAWRYRNPGLFDQQF